MAGKHCHVCMTTKSDFPVGIPGAYRVLVAVFPFPLQTATVNLNTNVEQMAYSATAVERRVVESRWLADRWTNLASSRTLKSSKNAARRSPAAETTAAAASGRSSSRKLAVGVGGSGSEGRSWQTAADETADSTGRKTWRRTDGTGRDGSGQDGSCASTAARSTLVGNVVDVGGERYVGKLMGGSRRDTTAIRCARQPAKLAACLTLIS